ncbi:9a55274f-3069-42f2-b558-0f72fba27dda [Thermothielavioides terrestris]|uniref:9a55274f-3069-42f2-b558-0f72fba27dda n=1 Tax=Thermothielavioides terrestris TaxID=2587410 RepID=A0A446BXD6_9PEZI|nr:9a55274f-3069-42f2-b558-0f72fba27dda [Thermothielavioides terrestris]
MADSEPSARRRKPDPKTTTTPPSSEPEPAEADKARPKKKSAQDRLDDDEADSSPYLDILRVLTFLFLASCGLSYLISGGETFFWGMSNPPKYLQSSWWKKQFRGPIYLTPAELAAYDGSDPSKPLYLAINWTIYDVSANRRTYGPGGSYHYFAGCDAARAYITGCFAEDRTPDLRGVEEMFLPLDDPAVDARYWTPAELERLRAQERREAERRAHDALAHWVKFFRDHPKYQFVGYVKRPEGWPGTEPRRPLCEHAAKARKPRTPPGQEQQ